MQHRCRTPPNYEPTRPPQPTYLPDLPTYLPTSPTRLPYPLTTLPAQLPYLPTLPVTLPTYYPTSPPTYPGITVHTQDSRQTSARRISKPVLSMGRAQRKRSREVVLKATRCLGENWFVVQLRGYGTLCFMIQYIHLHTCTCQSHLSFCLTLLPLPKTNDTITYAHAATMARATHQMQERMPSFRRIPARAWQATSIPDSRMKSEIQLELSPSYRFEA